MAFRTKTQIIGPYKNKIVAVTLFDFLEFNNYSNIDKLFDTAVAYFSLLHVVTSTIYVWTET